jgi:hypothetical protein
MDVVSSGVDRQVVMLMLTAELTVAVVLVMYSCSSVSDCMTAAAGHSGRLLVHSSSLVASLSVVLVGNSSTT